MEPEKWSIWAAVMVALFLAHILFTQQLRTFPSERTGQTNGGALNRPRAALLGVPVRQTDSNLVLRTTV